MKTKEEYRFDSADLTIFGVTVGTICFIIGLAIGYIIGGEVLIK